MFAHTPKSSAAENVARRAALRRLPHARISGVLGALLATAGCAVKAPGRPVPPAAVPQVADAGIQCYKQHITGSLIATQVCTTKAQREGIQESTQDAKDFLNNQVIAACPGTPGC